MRFKLVPLLLSLPAFLLSAVKTTRFHGRDAWTVETPQLRVTILQGGGHVGEIVLAESGGLNPLWIQKRQTIEPEAYNRSKHEALYGGGSGARLMSGLMGHNLCFPFWGDPSPSETAAGMTFHGETGVARWKQIDAGEDFLTISADLAESKTLFTRTVRVRGPVVWFQETAANASAWDRPVGWCEHVTLGPPFLEKGVTLTDASLTRGRVNGDPSGAALAWPAGAEGQTRIDLRRVRNIERSGFVNNFLVDPQRKYGFFAAVNARLRLLFGYVFRRADFPWLNIWEANNPDMLTRGMEFSDTPVHGTMKALLKSPELYGVPTFEWLDAKGKLTKRFCAFSARVPEDYKGVADIIVNPEHLQIRERDSGKTLTVALDPSLAF